MLSHTYIRVMVRLGLFLPKPPLLAAVPETPDTATFLDPVISTFKNPSLLLRKKQLGKFYNHHQAYIFSPVDDKDSLGQQFNQLKHFCSTALSVLALDDGNGTPFRTRIAKHFRLSSQ